MTTATIPTGSRSAVLRDLRQRMHKAEQIAQDAETDAKYWRALERYWLRLLQVEYVEQMPKEPLCLNCVFGEEDWMPGLLTTFHDLYSCLEHWTPALERKANEIVETDRAIAAGQAV